MAYKAVTVRLDEQDIRTLDALAEHFSKSNPEPRWLAEWKLTRSDVIRACVRGWLTDHHAVVEKMLAER